MIKCDSCGFENEENTSYCHRCGVNLKKDDMQNFKDNAEVLNREFKVVKKRKTYPVPPEDSLKAKLMYKHDKRTGQLRLSFSKCATIVVFFGFGIFGFIVSIATLAFFPALFIGFMFGLIFAVPVAIIGFIIGKIMDMINH